MDIRTSRVQISSEVLLGLFFPDIALLNSLSLNTDFPHITENTSSCYNFYIFSSLRFPVLKRLATQSVIWKNLEKTHESV